MLLYSFLGVLTLQIGVAVLAVLFAITGIVIAISTFSDLRTSAGIIPINYIIVAVFVVLFLMAGICMFVASYKESIPLCLVSVLLLAIIFILYLILSAISFANQPKLNKMVCVPGCKCPESLWLPHLKYKTVTGLEQDDNNDYVDGTTTTSTTNTSTTTVSTTTASTTTASTISETKKEKKSVSGEESNNNGKASFEVIVRGRRRRSGRAMEEMLKPILNSDPGEERHHKDTETPLHTAQNLLQNNRGYRITQEPNAYAKILNGNELGKNNKNVMIHNSDSRRNVIQNMLGYTEANRSLEDNRYLVNYKSNEGIIKLVKRSVYSIVNYIKGEHLTRKHSEFHPKKKVEYENDDSGEDEAYEYETDADAEGEKKESEYIFGFHFIIACILVFIIVILLIFSLLILWSYKTQLKYIKRYSLNPSSDLHIP